MSEFFHATSVATFGLIQLPCEHGNLTFACHSASCRPPTSGGTGGSSPGGPTTAFGRSIQAAIAAEPALAGRMSYSALVAEHDKGMSEFMETARADQRRRLDSGKTVGVTVNSPGNWSSEARDTGRRLEAEIRKQFADGAHHKFMENPDAEANGPMEQLLKNYVTKRLAEDPTYYAHERGDMTLLVNGEPVVFSVVLEGRGIGKPKATLLNVDDGKITPEFEAASTRVGALINNEIKARITDKVAKADEAYEAMAAEMRAGGVDPDDISFGRFRDGTITVNFKPISMVEKSLDPMTDDQRRLVADALNKHGVRTPEKAIHMLNAQTKAQEETFGEVMREIMPMGGKVSGTPAHRKGKGAYSTHEQVTIAAGAYPTGWIQASNFRGSVDFKTSKSRGHYRDFDSSIVLNGTPSVAVHELGHRMEYSVPGLRQLESHFYKRRTEERNESGSLMRQPTPVELSKLYPGARYGKDEKTIEDGFFDSYAGKRYPDAFELFTMGMEAVAMGKKGTRSDTGTTRNTIDDDHAAFILGALVTLVAP